MSDPTRASGGQALLWLHLAVVGGGSLALSRAFACATPFAAIATLAVFGLRGPQAVLLVLLTWAANQVIGFTLLHYPTDPVTLAWGVAIGAAALAALGASAVAKELFSSAPLVGGATASLLCAYASYELVLLAATVVLPSASGAFAFAVVMRLLAINAVTFALLGLLLQVVNSLRRRATRDRTKGIAALPLR